ncbi:MAG TPA: non-canonical purine NTP pyrophosphatase [Candidatus Limnocylindria bacterium]|nr:non-canonical purine NTP pyrophosphatase [Candidatus Limnocylindria bacterium]
MSAGRRLLIATGSEHKLAELRQLLDLPSTTLVSLAQHGLPDDAPEEGATFEKNATSKAAYYAVLSGLPTLADDSGLEVDWLGGRPGVRTRRYAGESATDEENNTLLLRELGGVPAEERSARYRCVLVLAEPQADGSLEQLTTAGTFEGRIALAPRGAGGFGYDPIFEPAGEPVGGRTVGQLSAAEKNEVSHRAQAARRMSELLRERGY